MAEEGDDIKTELGKLDDAEGDGVSETDAAVKIVSDSLREKKKTFSLHFALKHNAKKKKSSQCCIVAGLNIGPQ